MKKYLSIFTALLMVAFICSSCVDDADNHAEAEVHYAGVVDSIHFTDQADTAFYKLINEALYGEKLKVAGNASVFSKKANLDNANVAMAVAYCDSMAHADYQKILQAITLDDVKSTIFNAHNDSLVKVGITSPDYVPVSPFTAYISLYSSWQDKPVFHFRPTFR